MSSRIELDGYRVLITGSSTGIGAAAAQVFAACGASVCIHYNSSADAAEALADQIRAGGGTAYVVAGDLSKAGVAAKIAEDALDQLGGLDVLVNNAGAMVGRTPLADFDDAIFEQVVAFNIRSVAEMSRAVYPALKASTNASIVNVGSIAGRNGGAPGSAFYAATKAAVHGLTRSMAAEFAPDDIRVNAVAPGFIVTPFHAATPADRQETVRKTIPLKRLGTAEDCAWAFAFLASGEMAGYITGQIIDINGGQMMP